MPKYMHTFVTTMENQRPKNTFGLRSNIGYCKKHPRHRQAPGVCSVCLGERLSQLPASSSGNKANKVSAVSSCSSSSYLSSLGDSSSEGSPMHHKYRLASMKIGTSGVLKGGREDKFRKSKSLAAVERVGERKGEGENKEKKKRGFWSKLFKPRKKKMEVGLVHPSMATTRVH